MAGANLIYGLGMIEMGMTFDFGQLVLDNEIARMVKHVVNGIAVNDETLAVDITHEIGIGKDFLSHDSTLQHMRTLSTPQLFDRSMREAWVEAGEPDLYRKATAKAREVLAEHVPEPLPDGVREAIREIVTESEAELGLTS